ncbi:hypothetical protein K501DRAFT_282258 [Backusella circina FSU 941]|nr:hypothetical protein K501DRAFT_282258 [Backusella circina FSU 941]
MNDNNKDAISSFQSCQDNKNFEIDKEYEASASSMAEEIGDEADTINHHPYLHHYHNNQHIPFFKKDNDNSGNSSTDSSIVTKAKKSRHQKIMQQRENQPSPLHMTTTEPEEVLTPNSGYEGDTEGPLVEDGGRT